MSASKQCNVTTQTFLRYLLPSRVIITLEPRTTCGFRLAAFSSILRSRHKYPVVMYHSDDGTPVNYSMPEKALWNGKREEPGDCLNFACDYSFDLVREKPQYFFLANWDRYETQEVWLELDENSAVL